MFTIDKGLWSIEADFAVNFIDGDTFSESFSSSNKNLAFSFMPKVGYAINKNLILGLGVGYNYSESDSESLSNESMSSNKSTVNTIAVFPYVKKFFPISKNLAFNLQGETRFSLSKGNFDSTSINDESSSESFFIGIRPGINYFLSENILLQANFGSLGYQYTSSERNSFQPSATDEVQNRESNLFRFDFSSSNLIFGMTLFL